MSSDWKLIAAGFGIAGLGSVATMLYIVGASAIYIGRYAVGGGALAAACVIAVVFRRRLGRFLDTLDARAGGAGEEDDDDAAPAGKVS